MQIFDVLTVLRQERTDKHPLVSEQKKALREQWLMDGLSGQNDEEEEAMRVQAQEEQQQTELLQSEIDRYSKQVDQYVCFCYTAYAISAISACVDFTACNLQAYRCRSEP